MMVSSSFGIIDIETYNSDIEKSNNGFWDDLHAQELQIVVKENGQLGMYTKYWDGDFYYINTDMNTLQLWEIMYKVSEKINRTLIHSRLNGPWIYIPNLNRDHIQYIYNLFKEYLGDDIVVKTQWDTEGGNVPNIQLGET